MEWAAIAGDSPVREKGFVSYRDYSRVPWGPWNLMGNSHDYSGKTKYS